MKTQSKLSSIVAMFIGLFVNSTISHAMEKETTEIFSNLSSLPTEVRAQILLQNPAIKFLNKQPITFKGHNDPINSMATTKDKLITGSGDKTAKIWDINSTQLLHTLKGHTDEIWSVATTNDKVITGSGDKTAKIWDINTGKLLHTLAGLTSPVNSVAATENEVITASDDNTAKIWTLYSGQLIRTLEGHTSVVTSVAVAGDKIVTGSMDKTVKIWNLYSGKLLGTLKNTSWVMSVTIKDDKIIAGLTNDTANIWDINTNKLLHTLEIDGESPKNRQDYQTIIPIAIIGNEVLIGSDLDGGIVMTWDIDTNKLLHKIKIPKLKAIAMTENRLIAGLYDGNIRIQKSSYPNLNGTAESNPLLWILYNATTPQLEFIIRACETTLKKQDLIIAMPPKLGTIQATDSQEEVDGNTYFSLPPAVRAFLRSRLNIRRGPITLAEKFLDWAL
jgi:WD40 repeat protein